jgi:NDP-sugar pyrophosphorylase family protein
VCILAGGVGKRLGARVQDVPKPLLKVADQPFLVHQLRLLARNGVANVVMCVGYLGELIERAIGPSRFGVRISYSYDGPGLDGTLGAIRRAGPQLGPRFLVLYGDTYLRLDYRAAADAWQRSGLPAMMTVLQNRGRWDASNAEFDGERVTAYDKRSPIANMSWIDYGLGGLTRATLELLGDDASDLSDLYHVLAARRELFGFEANERFYEIGTPRGLRETDKFLRSMVVPEAKNTRRISDESLG